MNPFSDKIQMDALTHGMEQYPHEACGLILSGEYTPCDNVAMDPTSDFEIDSAVVFDAYQRHGSIEGVWHSHTNGNDSPTRADMRSQIDMQVPWGVTVLKPRWGGVSGADYVGSFTLGDHTLETPLVGRHWRPGVYDCFGLLRGYFKQTFGVVMADLVREGAWWEEDTLALLSQNLLKYPDFEILPVGTSLRRHDVLLMTIRSSIPNHFSVLVEDNLILHHPSQGLSSYHPLSTLKAPITHIMRLHKWTR